MLEWITGISGIVLGSGATGFIQFVIKRMDEQKSFNKQLLSPLVDELCNICSVAYSLINFVEEQNVLIANILSEERRLYKDANLKLSSTDKWQDELMAIYQKKYPSDADISNIKYLLGLINDRQEEYSSLITQALGKPEEARQICKTAISKIIESLSPFKGVNDKETKHYKLSDKKLSRKITKIFKDIDKMINRNNKLMTSCSYFKIPNTFLIEIYKIANDGKLLISDSI